MSLSFLEKKAKLLAFVKREAVLVIATILALISTAFVHPDKAYAGYVDFRVLGILLSLMTVMAGLRLNGLFDRIGQALLNRTKSATQLVLSLVFLCFFSAMLITNDVALITFVPFAMLTLKQSGRGDLMIPVLVLQTLAANLGSMLTPIGNPQNLYLYSLMGISLGEFVGILLPATLTSGALLLIGSVITGRRKAHSEASHNPEALNKKSDEKTKPKAEIPALNPVHTAVYGVLFIASLLVVLHVLEWLPVTLLTVAVVLVMDRRALKGVDVSLLLTFVAFFVFTGNMGRVAPVRAMLETLVVGRETLVGVLVSQVISNVPAALLLAGFTQNLRGLLIGVNLGGLGTLIASMASLISYKLYAREEGAKPGAYMAVFTVANIVFLLILAGVTAAM